MSAAKPVAACQLGPAAAHPSSPGADTIAGHACPHPNGAARGIVRQHGVRGLYRGLGVTVLEIMPYAALQFGLYDVFNAAYNRTRVRFMGGAICGACCSPVRGRGFDSCPQPHSFDTQRWLPSIPCGCPPFLSMWRHPLHSLQARLDPAHADEPSTSVQAFVCGLAAGMLAKLGTHPLDVAKKRFQVAGLQRSARYGQVGGRGSGCCNLMLCAVGGYSRLLTMLHALPHPRFPQLLHIVPCLDAFSAAACGA